MRVSTQFPLAVHALMMIAYFPQVRVTSDMVAESAGCNAVIIRNIFLKLKKSGLLSVSTGRGNTELTKPPEDISLWDIYSAVESDETDDLFKMHTNTSDFCPVGGHLRSILLGHLDDAVEAMKKELLDVSLAAMKHELLEINGCESGCNIHEIPPKKPEHEDV